MSVVQRIRDKVLARDSFRCVRCGETETSSSLHVHEGVILPAEVCETLCGSCHQKEHNQQPAEVWELLNTGDTDFVAMLIKPRTPLKRVKESLQIVLRDVELRIKQRVADEKQEDSASTSQKSENE